MEATPHTMTEPESEAALCIKPGDWIEVCIATSAELLEHSELLGAILRVQIVDSIKHEITAGDRTWPAHNVRKVEHPHELQNQIAALRKELARYVAMKTPGSLEGRVASLEQSRDLNGLTIKALNSSVDSMTRRLDILSDRISNLHSSKIGAA